jgi:hypothetical protein
VKVVNHLSVWRQTSISLASAVQVGRGRKIVAKNKAKSVPRLKSIDKLVKFFDKHDMGDCWDRLPKAEFEVKIKTRKHPIAIDEKIYSQHQPRVQNRKELQSGPDHSVKREEWDRVRFGGLDEGW